MSFLSFEFVFVSFSFLSGAAGASDEVAFTGQLEVHIFAVQSTPQIRPKESSVFVTYNLH